MAIDTTNTAATAKSSTPQSASATAQNQLGVDYNNFLKLLTAQIQNQDPLQPMDSTQFVSQLAQLSQVEQAVQTNSNLETVNTKLNAISGVTNLGLVGRDVTVASDKMMLKNGSAATTYELSGTAASATATIVDGQGNVVRTIGGLDTSSGSRIALNWDGRTDSGQMAADGTYHVAINALDGAGKKVSYDTYATTTVEKVQFDSSGDTLQLANGDNVPVSQIVSIQ